MTARASSSVDDEPQILRALELKLRSAGYVPETAATAQEALTKAALRPPDAIILDVLLPDGHGAEVARELRTWTSVPILIVSAVGDEAEKIAALDAGADDYVTKPFSGDELLARLRAALRRAVPTTQRVHRDRRALARPREARAPRPRQAGLADADRVRPAAPARGQRGQAPDPPRDPERDLGPALPRGVELPARLRLAPAPQDRARPGAAALPAEPAGRRLPARRTRARARLLRTSFRPARPRLQPALGPPVLPSEHEPAQQRAEARPPAADPRPRHRDRAGGRGRHGDAARGRRGREPRRRGRDAAAPERARGAGDAPARRAAARRPSARPARHSRARRRSPTRATCTRRPSSRGRGTRATPS